MKATGSELAVCMAIFSRAICSGVPSGLTWFVRALLLMLTLA